MDKKPKTAVLLYGLLRSYKATAGSFLRHVVTPSNADVFYFGPSETDAPLQSHWGAHDERGFFVYNPKGDFEQLSTVGDGDLSEVYGSALTGSRMHRVSQHYFKQIADKICPREEWLFMLSPHRLISMFYNISGVVALLKEHEVATSVVYDQIILTRPDLAFYRPVIPRAGLGEIHLPAGEGFDANGAQRFGNAGVYFYKNASNGDFTPGERVSSFNDQVIAIRRSHLNLFEDLYSVAVEALRNRVPASPETIFHLLFVERAGLRPVVRRDWVHEIFRIDDELIKNVADTPAIAGIDPRHQRAERFLSAEERDRIYGALSAPKPQPHASTQTDDADHPIDGYVSEASLTLRMLRSSRRTGLWRRLLGWRATRAARKHARQGQWASAAAHYRAALRRAPRRYRIWIQFGHALKHSGHLRAAAGAYETALLLHPGDVDATVSRDRVRQTLAQASIV